MGIVFFGEGSVSLVGTGVSVCVLSERVHFGEV